jgi:hypothetical protein
VAPEIEAYSTLGVKAIDQVNIDDAAEVLSRSFFLDPMFQFFFRMKAPDKGLLIILSGS